MESDYKRKKAAQIRRKRRIRKKISGSSSRPRLVVTRSLKHIAAALIDDERGHTLTSIFDGALKADEFQVPAGDAEKKKPVLSGKTAMAYQVGVAIAAAAKGKGITQVVFDRNGLRYHGRVKAVADGARKGGLIL
ncbi:50S ribosomal protein L18 [Calditrichota bacterium]